MKITDIQVFELKIPFSNGVNKKSPSSFLTSDALDFCLVKIETDQGKEEYESLQRGFSLKADSIRKRIFSETKKIIGLLGGES